jgi:CheY-like chemotaxis protein
MRSIVKKWPLALAALLLAMFTGVASPWVDWDKAARALEQFRLHPAGAVVAGPKVLLVSARESDRFSVSATLEPRGYSVLLAGTVKAGMAIIGRQPDGIALVVIDTTLPQSKRLLQAAKRCCPGAHVIALNGPQRIGQVSALLINTAVD